MNDFNDKPFETSKEKRDRVLSIGKTALLTWWAKAKHKRHLSTYGYSGTEFASSCAYALSTGGPSKFQMENPDIFGDMIFVIENIR